MDSAYENVGAIDCPDRAGFVVNALLIPFILSAIRTLESGYATAEDIDAGSSAVAPILRIHSLLVDAGLLGQKDSRGFYT